MLKLGQQEPLSSSTREKEGKCSILFATGEGRRQRIQLSGCLRYPGSGCAGPASVVLDIGRVFFVRGGGGGRSGKAGGEGLSFFSHRFLSEAANGGVECVKELFKAKANVDKVDKQGRTALLSAVNKMENLMSEKRPRFMCKGIALLSVTLRTRYRRIPLSPSSPLRRHLPK